MPYIKMSRRAELVQHDSTGVYVATKDIVSAGELNFVITALILDYFNGLDTINYAAINNTMGALECAKLELYRRLAAPYEDKKIEENGDVYPDENN